MKPRKVTSRGDFDKVILTETVPYEVPILFSNFGYYCFIRDVGFAGLPFPLDKIFTSYAGTKPRHTISFDYCIKRDANEYRKLSLVHPFSQYNFVDFYKKYKEIMVDRCGVSATSLRYPSAVARYFYERDFALNIYSSERHGVDEDPGIEGSQSKIASSFFNYKKFNFIYKFYESSEFHGLERRYKSLLRFDVSKCFHHIYTHSVAWAVKGKGYAKSNTEEKSFENTFDKLMQRANYNETNGIVVGPEVSRVFAEIILQRIDLDVKDSLEVDGFFCGQHYSVRRYIDDYFVFFNDEACAEFVLARYKKYLSEYKLYLNDAKTKYFDRPFITKQSITKVEVRRLLDGIFSSLINKNMLSDILNGQGLGLNPINKIWNVRSASNAFIRDIKSVVKANDADFECMANYAISAIIRNVKKIASAIKRKAIDLSDQHVSDLLLVLIDIVFFIFCMSPRVRSSYLVGQFVLLVNNMISGLKKNDRETIKGVLIDELASCLRLLSNASAEDGGIEKINILIVLTGIEGANRLPRAELMSCFGIGRNQSGEYAMKKGGLSYFEIVALLYYYGRDDSFSSERDFVKAYVKEFIGSPGGFIRADYTHLFFDLLACPYLDDVYKEEVIQTMLLSYEKGMGDLKPKIRKIKELLADRAWFFNWQPLSEVAGLEKALKKKELRTAY